MACVRAGKEPRLQALRSTLVAPLPPPRPQPQRAQRALFDDMVAALRYGTIAVNVPSLIGFATTSLGWGAFPGGTPQVTWAGGAGEGGGGGEGQCVAARSGGAEARHACPASCPCCSRPAPPPSWPSQDIGSGNCFVHNTLLFDHVQKSVLYAPWRFHPAPFWCGDGSRGPCAGPAAARCLCACAASPPSRRCYLCPRTLIHAAPSLPPPLVCRSPTNRNLEAVGLAALRFSAQPSVGAMLPLAAAALRG